MLRTLVLTLVAVIGVVAGAPFEDLNSKIDWVTWDRYRKMDLANNNKPVMYLLTQPWCGACKGLKKSFVENGEKLVEMSSKYIMVTVDGEDNSKVGEEFSPDGSYIPRIFFATPDGKVDPSITKPSTTQYKYFYSDASQVANAMEKFLEASAPSSRPDEDL